MCRTVPELCVGFGVSSARWEWPFSRTSEGQPQVLRLRRRGCGCLGAGLDLSSQLCWVAGCKGSVDSSPSLGAFRDTEASWGWWLTWEIRGRSQARWVCGRCWLRGAGACGQHPCLVELRVVGLDSALQGTESLKPAEPACCPGCPSPTC